MQLSSYHQVLTNRKADHENSRLKQLIIIHSLGRLLMQAVNIDKAN